MTDAPTTGLRAASPTPMRPVFLFLLASVALQALAVAFAKQAALSVPAHLMPHGLLHSWPYLLSLGCLGLQAVAWQIALRAYPLAWAYQFQSLAYVFILVISSVAFREDITLGNVVGSAIIVAGVTISSRPT